MIEWCSNKNVTVFFDDIPRIGIRYVLPSTEKELKKSIKKFPFILNHFQNIKKKKQNQYISLTHSYSFQKII